MRKLFSVVLVAVFMVSLASCGGGGMKGDVKKMVNKACECAELEKGGDSEGADKCGEEMEAMEASMEDKYDDLSEEKEAELAKMAMEMFMDKCPEAMGM